MTDDNETMLFRLYESKFKKVMMPQMIHSWIVSGKSKVSYSKGYSHSGNISFSHVLKKIT